MGKIMSWDQSVSGQGGRRAGKGCMCHHGTYSDLCPGEMTEWGTWDEVHKINLRWMGTDHCWLLLLLLLPSEELWF